MRIGIDGRYAFRTQRRGIGEYIVQLLTQYAEQANEEFVVYIDGPAVLTAVSLPKDQFKIKKINVTNPLIFEEFYLPRSAEEDKLDLLHITANYGPTFVTCPTIYTIHDLIEFLRKEIGPWKINWRHQLGRAIRQKTLPLQARRARMIITPSNASQRDIVRILGIPERRIRVIPYGAPAVEPAKDVKALRADLRRRGYPVPSKYVLAFMALDPRKNGEIVIEAFQKIAGEFSDTEIWLVGIEDLSMYPKFQKPWVRRFGYLPRNDVVDILRASDAFVFPSKYEGFGFPALEAMKAGVPLIASNSSSIPELVGDAGILFAPDDASTLAAGLREVLRGGEKVENRRLLALRRAALFDWRSAAREHLDAYRSVGGAGS